jgi:oligosaccharyltransferase complex subunit alpha (ribophorin I)
MGTPQQLRPTSLPQSKTPPPFSKKSNFQLGDLVFSGVIPSITMRFFTATVLGLLAPSLAAATNLTIPSRLALPSDFKPAQVFKNTNLVRNTNLEKGYVRETVNVVVENVDTQPQSDYYIPFPADVFERVGGFEVRDKKATGKGRFEVDVTEAVSSR